MGSTFLVSNFVCFSICGGVGVIFASISFFSNSGFFTIGATGVGGIVGKAAISFLMGSTFLVSNFVCFSICGGVGVIFASISFFSNSGFFSIGSTVEGGCLDNN